MAAGSRKGMSLLAGIGIGALAMYAFDPNRGKRRRSAAQVKAMRALKEPGELIRNVSHGMKSRVDDYIESASSQIDKLKSGDTSPLKDGGSWSPTVRFAVGTLGAVVAAYGSKRARGMGGIGSALVGTGALLRAVTNKEFRSYLGGSGKSESMTVEKSITINKPVEEVFKFWSQFENFPQFMSNLKEVKDLGEGRSHWVASGPIGTPFEWDAVITDFEESKAIGWESEPGSTVENSGMVEFEQGDNDSTEVYVVLSYNPPGGALGRAAASFLGSDPKKMMDEDLQRLKSLLENGKTESGNGEVSLEEVGFPAQ